MNVRFRKPFLETSPVSAVRSKSTGTTKCVAAAQHGTTSYHSQSLHRFVLIPCECYYIVFKILGNFEGAMHQHFSPKALLSIECAFPWIASISRLWNPCIPSTKHQPLAKSWLRSFAAKKGGGVNSAPALSFGFPMKLVSGQLEEYSNHSSGNEEDAFKLSVQKTDPKKHTLCLKKKLGHRLK